MATFFLSGELGNEEACLDRLTTPFSRQKLHNGREAGVIVELNGQNRLSLRYITAEKLLEDVYL